MFLFDVFDKIKDFLCIFMQLTECWSSFKFKKDFINFGI
jgi:hypothetical protein